MEEEQVSLAIWLLVLPSLLPVSWVAVTAVIYYPAGSLSSGLFANESFEGCWKRLKVDSVRHLAKFVLIHSANDCAACLIDSSFLNDGNFAELQEPDLAEDLLSSLTEFHLEPLPVFDQTEEGFDQTGLAGANFEAEIDFDSETVVASELKLAAVQEVLDEVVAVEAFAAGLRSFVADSEVAVVVVFDWFLAVE